MIGRYLMSSCAMAVSATAAAADFNLTILHTNDFHDRFEPISAFDSTCAPEDTLRANVLAARPA